MDFVAVDVETANPDMASICQIGLAEYRNGVLYREWVSYVDPEDYFDSNNVQVHGIDEKVVLGSPTFLGILDVIREFLGDSICVCHTHFDRVSIARAFDKYLIPDFEIEWLDSAKVARRTWEECAWKGYGLGPVCSKIGYEFKHHDALEDAKACAQILLAAIETTGLDLSSWLVRVQEPISSRMGSRPTKSGSSGPVKREGNPEGELYGEVMVFTGALIVSRGEAADLAASVGCSVSSTVSKKISLLVVGDQDVSRLAGKSKSSKHLKAEQLISKGHNIRILRESDFLELVRGSVGHSK
tara:strand:+ start:415 stop:1311 length:897 start_codon:yes stop_codon:yes gene_type:complete